MKKPTPLQSEQYKRFIETARRLECDEDKDRFEAQLKQIATTKTKATDAPKRPKS